MRYLIIFLLLPSLALAAPDFPEPIGELIPVEYKRTIDGDTVVVMLDGIETNVQLFGINAPELTEGTYAAFFSASVIAMALTETSQVFIEMDPLALTDQNGLTPAWVWLSSDGNPPLLLNLNMVANGMAEHDPETKSTHYQASLIDAVNSLDSITAQGFADGKANQLAWDRQRVSDEDFAFAQALKLSRETDPALRRGIRLQNLLDLFTRRLGETKGVEPGEPAALEAKRGLQDLIIAINDASMSMISDYTEEGLKQAPELLDEVQRLGLAEIERLGKVTKNTGFENVSEQSKPEMGAGGDEGALYRITDQGLRWTKDAASYTYFSWKAEVLNSTSVTIQINIHLSLLDKDGFELGDANMYREILRPGKLSFSDESLIETHLWNQVETYIVTAEVMSY